MIDEVVHRETGSEVDDLDDVVGIVAEPGNKHGRIAFVVLVGLPDFLEADIDESGRFVFQPGIHQFAADRVAVEIGVAPPDDAGISVD